MATELAATNRTALWVSTPLLAAAPLWSWHPLWAAGIWTAYGIGAFLIDDSAVFPPSHSLRHPLSSGDLKKSPNLTVRHDDPTIAMITPTLLQAGPETVIEIIEDNPTVPRQSVNVIRTGTPPFYTHFGRSVNTGPIMTHKRLPTSSIVTVTVDSTSTSHLVKSATSIDATPSFISAGLEPSTYPSGSAHVPSAEPRIPSPSFQYDNQRAPGSIGRDSGDVSVFNLTRAVKMATGFSVMMLVLCLALRWIWQFLINFNILQHVQDWFKAIVEHMRNGYNTCVLYVQRGYNTVLNRITHLRLDHQNPHPALLRIANLLWGAQNPYVRVATAATIWLALAILASMLAWPLTGWTSDLYYAALSVAWSTAASGFHSALQTDPTAGLCSNVKTAIMHAWTAGRSILLYLTCLPYISMSANAACPRRTLELYRDYGLDDMGLAYRVFHCLPFLATNSCPFYALVLNRIVMVASWAMLLTLNYLTLLVWPAVPPHSPFQRAKRIVVGTLLVVFPIWRLMLVYPWDAPVVGWANVVSACYVVWYFHELLVPRWNALLRWLRIAPQGDY